jgi:uncharacterized membrane protein YgdD (TMEM256/DUF423 family)
MQAASCVRLGAVLGGLAVAFGAFGAHAMQGRYDERALATFETAVRYQMYHALALCLCGALEHRGVAIRAAAVCFALGIALFSGSLYGLVFAQARWLGAVTPFGGTALLVGWLALALAATKARDAATPPAPDP